MVSGRLDEAEADFRRATPEGEQAAKDAAPISSVLAQSCGVPPRPTAIAISLYPPGRGTARRSRNRRASGVLNELDVHGRFAVETVDMITALSGILATEGRYADLAKLAQIAIDTYATLGIDHPRAR